MKCESILCPRIMFNLIWIFAALSVVLQLGHAYSGNGHPPRIITPPKDQFVISGRVASFICFAIGTPAPTIEWRRNGKRLTTQRYAVLNYQNGSVLRIEPVKPGRDNATYECLAENGVGELVRASALLHIYSEEEVPRGFPTFSLRPHMQGVERGRNALIPCKASGDPEPTITWLKNNLPIDMNKPRYQIYEGSSLQISAAQESDHGHYECVAENMHGSAYSETSTLSVRTRLVPPYFSIPPDALYEVMPGSNLNLTCVAAGSPVPNVSWKKGNIELNKENIPIGRNVLTLTDVQESDNYTCVASSKLDKVEKVAQVIVRSLPKTPVNVQVSEVTPTSLRISWQYDMNNDIHTHFLINYKPKNANQFQDVRGVTTSYYALNGLTPYTEYEIVIVSVNNVGKSQPSQPIFASTGETFINGNRKPGSYPRNVQARPISGNSIVVHWEPPEETNGQVTSYKVYYTLNNHFPVNAWEVTSVDPNQLTTISDLQKHSTYTIRVQAITQRGAGLLSPPVQVITQQGVPSQPQNLHALSTSATSIQLQWLKPAHTGETIIGYEVHWNDTFTNTEAKHAIPDVETYTLTDLQPDTLYYVWVTAKSRRGVGAATAPIPVKTEQYIPEAPPENIQIRILDPTSLRIEWSAPLAAKRHGQVLMYKIFYKPFFNKNSPTFEKIFIVDEKSHKDPYSEVIDKLNKGTKYEIWMLAANKIGDGPISEKFRVETEEDVPGEPRDVQVVAVNASSIFVKWSAPDEHEKNGLIRGYQIHVQEMSSTGEPALGADPIRVDVADGNAQEFNITSLQPDTEYSVQVAAVTRKGDGTRSRTATVKTSGGVPTKPEVSISSLRDDPKISIKVFWNKPNHTFGQITEYKLRFGRVDESARDEIIVSSSENSKIMDDLEHGTRYEFRVSARNPIGWGQEAIAFIETPEGVPGAPPQNVTHKLQSPTTVVFNWDSPPPSSQNGKIIVYGIHFHKLIDVTPTESNHSQNRIVFSSLDENTEYSFKVRAYTSKGPGPWSEKIQIMTPGDAPPAPNNVQAMATSETSIEVWWDQTQFFDRVLGYTILYTHIVSEDLEHWDTRNCPLTWSAELKSLEPKTMYAIRVGVYTNQSLGRLSDLITIRTDPIEVPLNLQSNEVTTHSMSLSWKPPKKFETKEYKISYGAYKEFYDSSGVLQQQPFPNKLVIVPADKNEQKIGDLEPFTSYQVNVTAVGSDDRYRPPTKLLVTTAMAAPKPMVKPDTIESKNKQMITVILPQASEEYGPILHYFLVVVPKQFADKDPDLYSTDELSATPIDKVGPYISAKWQRRSIPSTFSLGDSQKYGGFMNRKLLKDVDYRIFVRAVVDTPQKSLFTSSPFSDVLNLENNIKNFMNIEPARPHHKPHDTKGVPISRVSDKSATILILSIVLAVMVVLTSIGFCIVKHRRQVIKTPLGDTSMKLLMSTMPPEPPMNLIPHPSDPVELRRLNYQTIAMREHPPIPITELENHIEMLKENENMKFSQEYESIDPGQQFTWENSNLPVNKSKNRYANVIAYDHSRVVLQPIIDVLGSDYINANYCDGYRKPNAYIATQGPLPETFSDFWRMCWEQRSMSIVMMTKLEERTRIKCDQYWPSKGCETYGDIEVTLTNYEELATYCIRTFTLKKVNSYENMREVRQFQFTAWPDHGVPRQLTPFLMFLRRVKSMNPVESGPLVIHCSAGVGRTGCYIVIDSMLERIKFEDTVDIYGHVTCLRAQRNYTVQTEDQYIFIYDCVLEAVIAGNTEVPSRTLINHINMLIPIVPGENCSGMELEFKKLNTMRTNSNDENKFISANLPVNKHKNRLMNILPYESTRVFLQPIRGAEGSDYINANFVDGYKYRNAYVATQGPLMETAEDFWRMIWEHNSNIVVCLTRTQEMGREKCFEYWPSDRSQRYSYFVVDPITEYNIPQYVLREFKITDARDGQSRMIRQFHYVDWPEQGVPKSGDGFIEFITQVHKTKEQFGHEGPITVHCSAGVGRTGVFIALSIVLERLQNEQVIDLFQTVRTLRTQRPGMVQTEDQYQFCYRAVLEYIEMTG